MYIQIEKAVAILLTRIKFAGLNDTCKAHGLRPNDLQRPVISVKQYDLLILRIRNEPDNLRIIHFCHRINRV